MQLDITFEQDNEALSMVLDNSLVLKADLGSKGELILNQAFKDLQEENPELYNSLRKIARELFNISDI